MITVGTKVRFNFALHRVTFADPYEERTGWGIVVDNEDYTVWPAPGYTVRVIESPNYEIGTYIHVTRLSIREVAP